jgi:hypothetical protein
MSRRELSLATCCLLLAAAPAMAANIGTSAPKTMTRTGAQWKDGGRIVGELIGFNGKTKITIEIFNSRGGASVAKLETIPGTTIYFTPVLKPGEYDMSIKTDGFTESKIRQIAVKTGADTMVNIEFGN